MIRTLLRLSTAAAALALSTTAQAAIPVIDPSAIARIREGISVATQQLSAVRQQVTEIQQMRNLIGQIGRGNLGLILQVAGIDFSGPQGLLSDVVALGEDLRSLGREMERVGVLQPGMSAQMGRNLSNARNAAAQIFYAPTDGPDVLTRVSAARTAMLRETGITGFALATTTKGKLTDTTQMVERLSQQARETTDLRQDVQANTAAVLALLAEVSKQTAIQAQMLEIEAARTLAADNQLVRRR